MSKRYSVTICMLLCSVATLASLSMLFLVRLYSQSGARISFVSREYDLGKAKYGEIKTVSLEFKNTGDEVLYVNKVSTDCKCIMGELQKKVYEPAESGSIEIQFTTRGSPGEKISHLIQVHSNDVKQPVANVVIKGEMEPSLLVVPREINLGTVRVGESPGVSIVVSSFGGEDKFDIISTSTTLTGAHVAVSDAVSTSSRGPSGESLRFVTRGAAYQINVDLPVQESEHPIDECLTICTTSNLSPTITVPIQGTVKSSFRLEPQLLFFLVGDTKSYEKSLIISSVYPCTLRMPNDPFIDCSTMGNGKSKVWTVRCSLQRGTAWQNRKGILKFGVHGHPFESSLAIPYSVLVHK